MVKRPSRRAESGRETLPEDREWSGGPSEEGSRGALRRLGVVGRSSQRVGRTSRRARSDRKPGLDGREWSGGPLRGSVGPTKGSGCTPEGPGVVGRPTRGLGVVRRPSQRDWSSQKALPKVQE